MNLEPNIVWSFFDKITKIPRASKNETQIMSYLMATACNLGLNAKQDKVGNVLISKPASFGFENRETIILQAHTDMVCEKNADVQFDFSKDAIDYKINGDWIKANGTTLGADNGIGVAMMLGILSDKTLEHPSLECLFTVDEETGLTGAAALSSNFLTGKTLINLDSEDDGEIFIGCAGGIDTTAKRSFLLEETPANYFTFNLEIKGLKGGHSGDDINKNRANAIKLLNRFLFELNQSTDLRLHKFEGGNLRNAIPREASVKASVPWSEKENVRIKLNHFIHELENEIQKDEPEFRMELNSEEFISEAIERISSTKLINCLYACANGVVSMSDNMPNLVETSTNLASIKMTNKDTITITTSQRSSVDTKKKDIAQQIEATFLLADFEVLHGDGYPGWKPNINSNILKIAEKSYNNLFHSKPSIKAIHAGLECGLFLEKYPFLDMISIGPQMHGVHSPNEQLSISSTQKCWRWLIDILKNT